MSDLDGARPGAQEAEAFWQSAQDGGRGKESGNDHVKVAEQALAEILGADWEDNAEPDEMLAMIQLAQSVAKGKDLAGAVTAIRDALKSM